MKKLILALVITLLFASCENVLDKVPLDTITDGAVWKEKTLADDYLIECYAEMVFYFETIYGTMMSDSWTPAKTYALTIADEAFASWTTGASGGPRSSDITIEGGVYEWWGYSTIRKLNIFLENMETSDFEDSYKTQRMAEARFLRAFAYFNIVKRYGGVPLITKSLQLDAPNKELYPERNKEADIYDFILSELDAIVDDLPETSESSDLGRANKYADLALKSRAAMYAASIATWGTVQLDGIVGISTDRANDYWQVSYNASKEIIQSGKFSLYNKYPDNKAKNFRNIFLDEGNSETIFSERFEGVSGKGHMYDMWMVPRGYHSWTGGQQATLYLEMAESFDNTDGTSGMIDRDKIASGYLWTVDELFGKKDPRFKASVYTQGTPWIWKGESVVVDYHKYILLPDGTILTSGSYKGVSIYGSNMSTWSTLTPFGIMKYVDDEDVAQWTFTSGNESKTDYIIFRLGEIYLNLAEAAIELGKDGEALSSVNTIRERAGMPEYTSITRDLVRKERKLELAFEGNRYFDVRRWRTAVDDLTGDFHGLQFILDGSSYEEGNYDVSTAKYQLEIIDHVVGTVDPYFLEKHYYLPISNSRTSSNSNLVENPSY